MLYPRTLWLMVSALAGLLVNSVAAQSTPPGAAKSAPSSTRSAAETLAQKQGKATLAAMQASVDKQRASVAGGLAAFIGQMPANPPPHTPPPLFLPPPIPPPQNTPAPDEMATATHPGLYCDPVSETDLAPIVLDAAQREGLEPRLLTAVIEQESAFRPCAVSEKGAQGLMQLMPATAQQFGLSDPFDIQQNIGGGARFLKELLTRYAGDQTLPLAAYNSDPTKHDEGGRVPAIPETTNYVREILRKLAAPAGPKPAVE